MSEKLKPINTMEECYVAILNALPIRGGVDTDTRTRVRKALIQYGQASYRRGFRNGSVSERALERAERSRFAGDDGDRE